MIRIAAIVLGIALCAYPLVAKLLEREHLNHVINTYESSVKEMGEEEVEGLIREAEAYNNLLCHAISSESKPVNGKAYEELLNLSGTGIMGAVEIPKISVNLPVYHGVSEEVLTAGIGHLKGTSLPVGGKGTHSILTGHRGLPSSQLFTRLDELERNDLFYIRVGNRILAYRVSEIQVIEPEALDKLSINAKEDKVSLITCTPYGINSHRLVVSGKRVPYRKQEYLSIGTQMASAREVVFMCLPCVMVGVVIMKYKKERRRRECEK